MTTEIKKTVHHLIEEPKFKVFGREDDLIAIRDILVNESHTVLLHAESGQGKIALCKSFFSKYKNDYDLIITISDFNYAISYFEQYSKHFFQNDLPLKEFFRTTKLKYLVFVSNMTQYDDEELLNKVNEYLPIDSPLNEFQHFVIQRYHNIPSHILGGKVKSYELQDISREESIALYRNRLVNTEISDADIENLYGNITKGNPGFIGVLANYINKLKITDIESLSKKLVGDNPRKSLLDAIHQEFKKGKLFPYKLFTIFIFYHSYDFQLQWVEYISTGYLSFSAKDAQDFVNAMVDYGIYRDIGEGGYIPNKGCVFILRELLPKETIKDSFAEFIYACLNNLKDRTLDRYSFMFIYRHLFYYIYDDTYFNTSDRGLTLVACAEAYNSLYDKPGAAISLAIEGIASLNPTKEKLIIARGEKALAIAYKHPKIAEYKKALEHFFKSFKLFTELNSKAFPFNSKPFLLNMIGSCYEKLNDYPSAMKFHDDAFQCIKEDENSIDYSESLHYIGLVYFRQKDYAKAIHSLRQSQRVAQKQNHPFLYECLSLTARSYYLLGDVKKANECINTLEALKLPTTEPIISPLIQGYQEFLKENQPSSLKYILGSSVLAFTVALFAYQKFK